MIVLPDVAACVSSAAGGLIGVLESDLPLNGKWWDYKKEAIPF